MTPSNREQIKTGKRERIREMLKDIVIRQSFDEWLNDQTPSPGLLNNPPTDLRRTG
jgi:hypothetical protein